MDSTGPGIYRNGESTAGLQPDLFYSTDKRCLSNSGIKLRSSAQPAEKSSPNTENWGPKSSPNIKIQCRVYCNFKSPLETDCKNPHC